MLTEEQNEQLTRVGPGTPMGELLRRYWYPVAGSAELRERPTKSIKLLGESMTLFRDLQGRLGLIGQRCAHRGVDLVHGIPENEGLRCIYHGWMYDATGQCLEQPAEPPESVFKEKVKLPAYPVQELGGLIWTYLGPEPAPLLPRWELFVQENVLRHVGVSVVPCNWLQCQENALDSTHAEWLHGHFGDYVMDRRGITDPDQRRRFQRIKGSHVVKVDFDPFEFGIIKRRLREGESEEGEGWRLGHPMVFPNMVHIGEPGIKGLQIRVPMDDTHTWHLTYQVYYAEPSVEVPKQESVPMYETPIEELPDYVTGQDMLAWQKQGEIADRTTEMLTASDKGIIMFRRMLNEQMEVVRDGGEPMNVFRDPAANRSIPLPMEDYGKPRNYRTGMVRWGNMGNYSPLLGDLDDLMTRNAEALKKSGG